MMNRLPFREIWAVDFEYQAPDGERPTPVCLVARELRGGRLVRLWQDELNSLSHPPYPTDDGVLFVAYLASAEINCHLALGWPIPKRTLDLYVEFRAAMNGLKPVAGFGLLGALMHYGLDSVDGDTKEAMRALAMRGGPYTATERANLLDYCQTDVDALDRLLPRMLPGILRQPNPATALGQALLRGRAMAATACMERNGVPIDVEMLKLLQDGWEGIKSKLVDEVDRDYGVYDGQSFRSERFQAWLSRTNIPWPRLPSGALDLSDDTFREMSRGFPQVAPLRELRHTLSQLRLNELSVGRDGRNRCLLSPFRARTGRNQPSNSKFIFGPSAWLRSLIKPPEGYGLAYVDYASQEIGIAAALSGDPTLLSAYRSGDVYLAFAKQAGQAPADATKQTHGAVRDACKAAVLGTNYGMGYESLARRLDKSVAYARELLQLHRQTYPTFWRWSAAVVDTAMMHNRIETVFGWPIHIGADANPRSLMNFPMQSHGAEMTRLACCLATEAGLEVCAPIHDALLLVAPLDQLDAKVSHLQECMEEASRIVLGDLTIRTDAKLVRWPDRYMDPRGDVMWKRIMRLLGVEPEEICTPFGEAANMRG